jgi:hypothetical protein
MHLYIKCNVFTTSNVEEIAKQCREKVVQRKCGEAVQRSNFACQCIEIGAVIVTPESNTLRL